MTICATCGNDYPRAFEVRMPGGTAESFDSFECAIQRLAPTCARCGLRVIGHGVEADERVFCSAHCARHAGHAGPVDRVGDTANQHDPAPGEAEMDRALEESFPASDPPSYWARDTGATR
jgi:hypothetical protein